MSTYLIKYIFEVNKMCSWFPYPVLNGVLWVNQCYIDAGIQKHSVKCVLQNLRNKAYCVKI